MSVSSLRTPAAGVVSGLLFAMAFPPLEWVLLAPLALVPWLVALFTEPRRSRALISGILFGLTFWCASIPWIVHVVTRFGGQSPVMGVVALAIAAVILSEWPALVAWGTVALARERSPWRLAAFPILWTASEHARSYVYGGAPWNLTAFTLYRHPVWTQSAALWGVYGVGFLVVATSSLLAYAAAARRPRAFLGAAALVLFAGVAGTVVLRGPSGGGGRLFPVALLQPNISQESRLEAQQDVSNYVSVLEQASEAAAARPELIVVPESAFSTYWEVSSRLRHDLLELARECECFVLFNDVDLEPDGTHYNAARIVGPAGLEGPAYRKVHLVPFGEYVPLPRVFFFVRQVSTEIGEFSAAAEPGLLSAGPLKVGTGVCYEILYPVHSWQQVRRGANLLATISNDSWYGAAGAQAQHFAGAVLRSVENRRYLLRAAITGISGIVDEKGRIVAELPRDRRGIIRGQARLFSVRTPWTRWGFLFAGVSDAAAVGVLLFGLAGWIRERRSRRGRVRAAGP